MEDAFVLGIFLALVLGIVASLFVVPVLLECVAFLQCDNCESWNMIVRNACNPGESANDEIIVRHVLSPQPDGTTLANRMCRRWLVVGAEKSCRSCGQSLAGQRTPWSEDEYANLVPSQVVPNKPAGQCGNGFLSGAECGICDAPGVLFLDETRPGKLKKR